MMFDATPAQGKPGVLIGFMEGANGVEAGRLAAAGEAGERASSSRPRGSSEARRSRASATSTVTGARRSGPGAAMAPTSRRGSGTSRARAASRARRSRPLGRHGDREALDGLRRRCDRVGHQGCGGSARGPRSAVAGTGSELNRRSASHWATASREKERFIPALLRVVRLETLDLDDQSPAAVTMREHPAAAWPWPSRCGRPS